MLEQVIGLDHVVVAVRDLDAAARGWQALGFTLSPRGTHSAHLGTGNHTIMFEDDYLELLGVLAETAHNAPTRAFLAAREGVERAAFTARDAAAGVDELRRRGIAATGPTRFGRPVDLPGGGQAEARFATFNWPLDERPGGMRLFACQHDTREAVWIAELQRHPNTARGIVRLEMLAADPAAAARQLGRLVDREPERLADGAWRVPSGAGRADFELLDRAILAARHPGVAAGGLPDDGVAALVLRVGSLAAAREALAGVPFVASADSLAVPAGLANGAMLVMIAD
jgi:hypothetical protein